MVDLKPVGHERRGMARISSALFLLLLITAAPAQQNPDFSGVYILKSLITSPSIVRSYPWKKLEGKVTLRVVQNRNSLEVTGMYGGKTDTLTYALDGSESKNVLPDGTSTNDRAEIRGRTLTIRSSLMIGGGELKGIPLHETQKWVLSPGWKLLTIRDHYQIQGIAMEDDGRTAIYARQ
jgi:hypothetical protein